MTIARVPGVPSDRPLGSTASSNEVLRELDSYRDAIRLAFEEGFALSKLGGPIVTSWERSEARQTEGMFALTRMSVGAITRPFQSCHCPAAQGEDCPLTPEECDARTCDYIGMPWFGARLRRVWDGFVRESMNGVVCSIPDSGLNTPAHRNWCLRCQRRYIELKTLVEMLEAATSTNAVDPSAQPPERVATREGQ